MKSKDAPTVFIVDDDAGMRESVQDLIESVGLQCQSFGTPQEFLHQKRGDGPSCMVLDVRLPIRRPGLTPGRLSCVCAESRSPVAVELAGPREPNMAMYPAAGQAPGASV